MVNPYLCHPQFHPARARRLSYEYVQPWALFSVQVQGYRRKKDKASGERCIELRGNREEVSSGRLCRGGGVRFRVALLNAATRTDEPLSRATVKLSKQSRSFSSSDYGLSIRSSELDFGI